MVWSATCSASNSCFEIFCLRFIDLFLISIESSYKCLTHVLIHVVTFLDFHMLTTPLRMVSWILQFFVQKYILILIDFNFGYWV